MTTVDDTRWIPARIAGAQCVELPASHLSSVEAEAEFSGHLQRFLE